ncbi:MAG TPA: LacI family DNA-binding transcriptional regulator [Anaerolineales bacterium]|nr:LacI family DNA-binding transcriptional regulator [Anaerolineales bacterium]
MPKPEKSLRKTNGTFHTTLKDVAKVASVSTKTVSRVVNQQGEISQETRQRVQAAIDQLGYRPNILARSLIHQRTNTLGVVAWGIDFFGPSRTVVGIEQQAHMLNYSLFLNLVDRPDEGDNEQVLDTLITHRVDGIIWAVPEVGNNRAWLESATVEQLPPIVFLSMRPKPGLAIVAVDNFYGAKQATQHLIEQGRRRIAVITGPLTWWEARERFAGWEAAMHSAHLQTPSTLVFEGEWSAVAGEQGLSALLHQEPGMDAVFACSDQIALGALGTAHRLGKQIPKDLAIVGFDNIPESACFWPPLTTVYQQLLDVGRIAVQTLHTMIELNRQAKTPTEAAVTIVKPELIVRASSL